MPIIYTLFDGREIRQGQGFIGLADVKYPSNWLAMASDEDLAAHQITKTETANPDPIPPTSEQLLELLAVRRWNAEIEGVMWNGTRLPTDRERRSALKDAADKVRNGTLQSPIAVAFSASAYASLTLEQMDGIVNAITQHVQQVFSDAMTVAAQVQDGTINTIEQLDSAWVTIRGPSS